VVAFDRRTYVNMLADDIAEGHLRETPTDIDLTIGNLGDRVAQHRRIVYKTGKYADIHERYATNSHLGNEVFNQLITRSRQRVILSHFGPNYNKTLEAGLVSINDGNASLKGSRFRNAEGYKKYYRWIFSQMTGDLDHPVNTMGSQTMSSVSNKLRMIADIAYLGQAGISSLVDVATMSATFRHSGIRLRDYETNTFKLLKDTFEKRISGDRRGTVIMRAHGATLDAIIGAASRRYGNEGAFGKSSDFISRMHNWTFNMNGMNLWNSVAQEATIDIMQRHFSRMVDDLGNIEPGELNNFMTAVGEFGISKDDLTSFSLKWII